MGAHVCMWLRCIERPIALVGIAPRLCTARRAHHCYMWPCSDGISKHANCGG